MVDRPKNKPGEKVVAEVSVEVLEGSREDGDVHEVGTQLGPLLVQEPQDDRGHGAHDKPVELNEEACQ